MENNHGTCDIGNNTRSIYEWLCKHAEDKGEQTALCVVDKCSREICYSWQALLCNVDKTAAYFSSIGLGQDSKIVIAAPNSMASVCAALAAWHLGCCVFFLSCELPNAEMHILLKQISPALVVCNEKFNHWKTVRLDDDFITALPDALEKLEDVSTIPARATATGGSTGIPKIIIEELPMRFGERDFLAWQMLTGQHSNMCLLICGSLHHSLFGNTFYMSIALGNKIVLMQHFKEKLFLSLVEKYSVSCFVLVPTMMHRIYNCEKLRQTDLSHVECMHHAGAACPKWLKKEWIALLGGEKIYEFYSMSEKIGVAAIRGDEWLKHEGSVGKGFGCGIEILDDAFNTLPPDTVGNVYFQSNGAGAHYLLEEQKLNEAPDHALSVGDMGYMDEEGYLYLVDRRSDMIITGGKNVYATELENLIKEYPQVADALVIGLPDPEWEKKVHAIIEARCSKEEFKLYSFADFCFKRLSNYKLPKTIELIERIPRDQSGKVNKRRLIEEREAGGENGEGFHFIKVPNGHQIYAWRKKKSAKSTNK